MLWRLRRHPIRVLPAARLSVRIADLGGIGVEFSRIGCFALTSV